MAEGIQKTEKHYHNHLQFITWFALGNTILFWIVGFYYLSSILASKTLFATSTFAYWKPLAKIFVLFYIVISWMSHLALLAFISFLPILPLIFWVRKKTLVTACILLGTVSAFLLLTDRVVFSTWHFHLRFSLFSIAYHELSPHEICFFLSVILCIFLIQSGWAAFIYHFVMQQKWYISLKKLAFILFGGIFFSWSGFILSIQNNNHVLAQQVPTLPFYSQILAFFLPVRDSLSLINRVTDTRLSQALLAVSPLHYPLNRLHYAHQQTPLHLVVIGIDAWRFDAMNSELTPHMSQFSKKMWQFKQHFSGGNCTQAGLFSLFYSLPANYWTSMLQQKRAPVMLDSLLNRGYQTGIFVSSDINVPAFNKTVFCSLPNIQKGRMFGETASERDQQVTINFQKFIVSRKKNKPFFAFLFYDTAHNYCEVPHIPAIYPVAQPTCNRLLIKKTAREDYINHYKNALRFVDNQVAMILDTLRTQGLLDKTIVIITGDHGEELDDNHQGYWGHSSNYTSYQLRTPLLVYWPGERPRIWTHQTTHYDVVPTLMKKMLGCLNPERDYSIGRNLSDRSGLSYLLAGSYMNMAVVQKERSITLMTSGTLYAADNHAVHLPDAKIDTALIAQALSDMHRYYVHAQ